MPGPWVTVAFARGCDHVSTRSIQTRLATVGDRLQVLVDRYHMSGELISPETRLVLVPETYQAQGRRMENCAIMLRSVAAHPGSRFISVEPRALRLFQREMTRFTSFLRSIYPTAHRIAEGIPSNPSLSGAMPAR
jgi:hypothetical protein